MFCVVIPLHSSHLLQPFDVSCFNSLKQGSKEVQDEYRRDIKKILDYDDFPSLRKFGVLHFHLRIQNRRVQNMTDFFGEGFNLKFQI